MKNKFGFALAALMAFPIMGWSASTISGEVDGGMGGVATTYFVVGASVTLISGSGDQATAIASTTTDAQGKYSFSNVPSLGFMQVVVNADGYSPNPASTTLAVNADTSLVVNFILTASGNQTLSGTSSIGGQVTGTTGTLTGIQVKLRRRATTTGTYFVIDSTTTDVYGSYLFSNIAAAGANMDINAYSLVVNTGGYNTFTSGNITVGDGATVISNIALTATALSPGFSDREFQGLRFSRSNGQLNLDFQPSNSARTLHIYGLNGSLQNSVQLPANTSHAVVSENFSPEKGFLFRVK